MNFPKYFYFIKVDNPIEIQPFIFIRHIFSIDIRAMGRTNEKYFTIGDRFSHPKWYNIRSIIISFYWIYKGGVYVFPIQIGEWSGKGYIKYPYKLN